MGCIESTESNTSKSATTSITTARRQPNVRQVFFTRRRNPKIRPQMIIDCDDSISNAQFAEPFPKCLMSIITDYLDITTNKVYLHCLENNYSANETSSFLRVFTFDLNRKTYLVGSSIVRPNNDAVTQYTFSQLSDNVLFVRNNITPYCIVMYILHSHIGDVLALYTDTNLSPMLKSDLVPTIIKRLNRVQKREANKDVLPVLQCMQQKLYRMSEYYPSNNTKQKCSYQKFIVN